MTLRLIYLNSHLIQKLNFLKMSFHQKDYILASPLQRISVLLRKEHALTIFYPARLRLFISVINMGTGKFPDMIKLGKITPIFKKNDEQLLKNYRPVF